MAAKFHYFSEKGMSLTSSQEDLLLKMEATGYPLDNFSSISALRKKQKYCVVISDRDSFEETILREIDGLKHYAQSRQKEAPDDNGSRLNRESPWIIIKSLEDILRRLRANTKSQGESTREKTTIMQNVVFPLLGLYRSYDCKYNAPVIYLFKENIDDYAFNHNVLSDYVFAFVYVHESMHAFYDSLNTKGYFSITELEEAFAECGMIDFLDRLLSVETNPIVADLFDSAYDNVRMKQKYGPYRYGFGLALQALSASEGKLLLSDVTSELMYRYREVSNLIPTLGVYDQDLSNYRHEVNRLNWVPSGDYDVRAENCYLLLKNVLYKQYPNPPANVINVLPGFNDAMNVGGARSKAYPTRLLEYRDIICAAGSVEETLFPIFNCNSFSEMLYYVISIMKKEGIDKRLHLETDSYGNKTAVYRGRYSEIPLCEVESKNAVTPGNESYINETLFTEKGLEYIPYKHVRPRAGNRFASPVRILADRFDHTFSCVCDSCGIIVYGPEDMILYGDDCIDPLFLRSLSRQSGANGNTKDMTRYDLTDLQGNTFNQLPKRKLVYEGVRSFVEANPSMSAAQLQAVFPKTLGWGPGDSKEVVMPVANIPAKEDRRYFKDILSASDCQVRVCGEWGEANIGNMVDALRQLGMRVDAI